MQKTDSNKTTDLNKRAVQGTKHALENKKIGGEFTKTSNPAFIATRDKVWTELYAKQAEFFKSLPHEGIKITLKDGKQIDGTSFETTPLELSKKLPQTLQKQIVVAKVRYSKKVKDLNEGLVMPEFENNDKEKGFELWDLERPLEGDCELEFCTFADKEGKTVYWHSSAHILGHSLENNYGAHLCIGPPLEEGFYYDCYMGRNTIDEKDYEKIEAGTKNLTTANPAPFQRMILTKEEALKLFESNPFKVQLIQTKIPDNGKTTAYKCGGLIDLCMGPHITNTKLVKALKVTKNSSSYWAGNAENDTLQRVYGVSFPSAQEMKEYEERIRKEKELDHRNIGTQQDLFMFHNLSPGSCFFYPHGAHIYNKLMGYIRNEYQIRGFSEVISPNIYNLKLWKTSGHYKNYKENLFMFKVESQGFGLKPMNCPGHCLMFDSKARSYKELPIRFADFGVLHRNEISGALSGLTRVRRFQQDDAHIFCTPEQIMEEVKAQLDFLEHSYNIFGFSYELFLSTRPEGKLGDDSLWDQAENALAQALDGFGKPWKVNPGDGAFYGPKIDIKVYDALKRPYQCGTIQLDFQLPIRFNLMFRTDEVVQKEEKKEGNKKPKKENINIKKESEENIIKKEGEEVKEQNTNENNKTVKEVKHINKKEKKAAKLKDEAEILNQQHEHDCCEVLRKEVYPKDEYDDEEFTWEEHPLKPGYKRPVMIHRAVLGSVERMFAILTEHYGGRWPFWLSPRQVIVCTLSKKFEDYAKFVFQKLSYEGFKTELDIGSQTLDKKIRNAQLEQFNYILVIGKEELESNSVNMRTREGEVLGKKSLEEVISYFKSLEPEKSKAENRIIEAVKRGFVNPEIKEITEDKVKVNNNVNLSELESKLKYDLYLSGEELGEEDKLKYAELKDVNIDRSQFPNIYKWKKLLSKTL